MKYRKPKRERKVTQTMMGFSSGYERSTNTIKEATEKFAEAQKQYRGLFIGDDEFLRAKIDYQVAQNKFDVAFEKESRRNK